MSVEQSSARPDFRGILSLSSREPGYAVALECLRVQAAAEQADPSLATNGRTRLHPDAWSWYQGALGEIEVGRLLSTLGPEWFVRHSVPIGTGTTDVDHLLIGPAGVFALNTKHHQNASVWVGDHVLRVNNHDRPHLKHSQSEARNVASRLAAKSALPVDVRPVLVIVGERSLRVTRASEHPVSVVSSHDLLQWLGTRPRLLSDTHLALLRLAAEEPGTWHVDPCAADTSRVMQRFERLHVTVAAPPMRQMTPTSAPSARPAGVRRSLLQRGAWRWAALAISVVGAAAIGGVIWLLGTLLAAHVTGG